jgi:hypothetical protein
MSETLPVRLHQPKLEHRSPGFQKGHPRYGGRRKGSKDRFSIDLREAIVAGIAATGFIEKDEQGNPVPTGKRGCQGFVEWLALHEPKTAAALFARVLPYYVGTGAEVPEMMSEADLEVQLKELGLPVGLIEQMQIAPAPLDPGELEDPYGVVPVSSDDTPSCSATPRPFFRLQRRTPDSLADRSRRSAGRFDLTCCGIRSCCGLLGSWSGLGWRTRLARGRS